MFRNWHFSKTLCLLFIVSVSTHEWSLVGVLEATIIFYDVGTDIFLMFIIFDLIRNRITGKSIWIEKNT